MENSVGTPIVVEALEEGIARITLNRPHKRNALDQEARELLLEALAECARSAHVVIITGAGGTFCAGMDVGELAGADEKTSERFGRSWQRVQEEIHNHPATVIACAAGYALGGGSTLIGSADLAVVSDDVQIGLPEISLGLYPGVAGPIAQLRMLPKRAAWLVLTGERIDGPTAVEWGLANLSVPDGELPERALELARQIARFDPVALKWSKRALAQIPDHVHEFSAAISFGAYTNAQIRKESESAHAE